MNPILDEEVPAGRFTKEEEDFNKKGISAEEAIEFLCIIQQSEFKVFEQLNKTPDKISLLGLLMNSKPHLTLLVKILNKAHMAQDISVEGFGGIINNITANNYLTFIDEEIPVKGRGHNRALHVFVKCLYHIMAKVFIDNGSFLNVMPKATLDKFPFHVVNLGSCRLPLSKQLQKHVGIPLLPRHASLPHSPPLHGSTEPHVSSASKSQNSTTIESPLDACPHPYTSYKYPKPKSP